MIRIPLLNSQVAPSSLCSFCIPECIINFASSSFFLEKLTFLVDLGKKKNDREICCCRREFFPPSPSFWNQLLGTTSHLRHGIVNNY